MHSLEGALSETRYIYGDALLKASEIEARPRVLSVGLGLGYVEILAAACFLKAGLSAAECGGVTYELIDALRDNFVNWLRDKPTQDAAFKQAYDTILEGTANVSVPGTSPPDEIKTFLRSMIEGGSWRLEGPLSVSTKIEEPFGCICFDAFSSKTSPDLWNEEFLKTFLTQASGERCVLSTYACTGTLKRALIHAEYALTIRAGFANKRDSTFAVKHAQP